MAHALVRGACTYAVILAIVLPSALTAQAAGSVRGRVTSTADGDPLTNVSVSVKGTRISAVTDGSGEYKLEGVPEGQQVFEFRWLGYHTRDVEVSVTGSDVQTIDIALDPQPVRLSDIVVSGPSRVPERVVGAPVAIAVVAPEVVRDVAITGQAAHALEQLPGVDVVQSGLADFNVNARGFNTLFSRRVLVLQDGRDIAGAFLGSPAWFALGSTLDDGATIEMVRGPSSALYGANAFNGVVNITTPSAREVVGTKVLLAGGGLATLQGTIRHGGVFGGGRFGYKINAGYTRSDNRNLARTRADGSDLRSEYASATDDPVPDVVEVLPLFGQTLDPDTRAAVGNPDPFTSGYASGRFDFYRQDGSVMTAEGGVDFGNTEVLLGQAGRIQVEEVTRPWGRVAWAAERFYLMAYYQSDDLSGPALNSGAIAINRSGTLQAEGQYNRFLFDGRGRVVLGASARSQFNDSEGTILLPNEDSRRDQFYAVFGQFEFSPVRRLNLVGAARLDAGDLFDAQVSPKAAIVFSPTPQQAFRVTLGRAFQSPSLVNLYLGRPIAMPADFSQFEAGLRASPLGPALAGVPDGELFTNSSMIPILALGNKNLNVETVTSLEAGYRGEIGNRAFLTVDAYYSRSKDFVSNLLPGVNPDYPAWTAPEGVPEAMRGPVEQTVYDLLGAADPFAAAALARTPDGGTAMVLSTTNVGRVDTYGVEIGAGITLGSEFWLSGNYSLFQSRIDSTSLQPGVELHPNTPRHKANASLSYTGRQGLDARVSANVVSGYDWAAGIFAGRIPARQIVDVSLGYQVNNFARIQVLATNIFDQERFYVYGGSVIRRRVLGGVTLTI